jgi:hypothetical protein
MGALEPSKRNAPASVLAARFGVTTRTVRNVIAEPRPEFDARARARQSEALNLRELGLSYAEIGKSLGISRDAASGLVRRGRQHSTKSAAA